jgi:hypothetical protein
MIWSPDVPAVTSEHDTLLERGSSNEHDFEFTVRVSELVHMYDQLSAELIQSKGRTREIEQCTRHRYKLYNL